MLTVPEGSLEAEVSFTERLVTGRLRGASSTGPGSVIRLRVKHPPRSERRPLDTCGRPCPFGQNMSFAADALDSVAPIHDMSGGNMRKKRIMAGAAGFLLLGATPLVVNNTASADQATKVVNIVGQDSFVANVHFLTTFRFEQGIIHVHQGQLVLFKNKTTDGHTITLVAAKDLPQTVNDVNNCNL